jgi:adenylate cyclase
LPGIMSPLGVNVSLLVETGTWPVVSRWRGIMSVSTFTLAPANFNGFYLEQYFRPRDGFLSEGKRRLAAIMFTDMVGYASLGQRNESLSLVILDEQRKLVRPILMKHSGREVKTIGDAFLVEFPSALDAVRCAYDIQRATREFNISLPEPRRFQLRVGVHLGDVVESSGDVSGDAVNVASRIEPLAEEGGVCLSRQVYDHVRNKFELPLTSLGEKTLKNLADPLEVFRMEMPWSRTKDAEASHVADRQRIAVLPFENISPSPGDAYISDGLTEETISTLSKITGLRVIARTSVLRYRGSHRGIAEIGRELGVGTLLEGSVRKMGDKLRVTVQLIDSGTEEHLWAEDFDRRMEDVFEVQKEIATRVAEELRVKLQPQELRRLEKKSTEKSVAFTLYLKGRYYWNERTEEGFRKAREYFEKAIEADPSYAQAYAGLADTYMLMAFDYLITPNEAHPKAKYLTLRALEIDKTLGEAHTTLGYIYMNTGSWKEAETEFKKAIDLTPSYPTAHFWYSILLTWLQSHDEAIAQAKKAEELDPFSPSTMIAVGQALTYARRYDEATGLLTRTAQANPDLYGPQFILTLAYLFKGDYTQAREEAKKAISLSKIPAERAVLALGLAEAGLGHNEETRKILKELEQRHAPMALLGSMHHSLGETDEAMRCLETAYRNGEASLGWLTVFPPFDGLRNDPRFVSLIAKISSPNKEA